MTSVSLSRPHPRLGPYLDKLSLIHLRIGSSAFFKIPLTGNREAFPLKLEVLSGEEFDSRGQAGGFTITVSEHEEGGLELPLLLLWQSPNRSWLL